MQDDRGLECCAGKGCGMVHFCVHIDSPVLFVGGFCARIGYSRVGWTWLCLSIGVIEYTWATVGESVVLMRS